jgi:putative oxidoreductase
MKAVYVNKSKNYLFMLLLLNFFEGAQMNFEKSIVVIRLMVGLVFFSEGIQKFLFPEALGSGRFATLGIPAPSFFGPFVGCFEIVCGTLVVLGLFTRFAVVPLLGIITVAILTTKVPQFLSKGFWVTAHEGRTDFSMMMGLVFLLLAGGGALSLDHKKSFSELSISKR